MGGGPDRPRAILGALIKTIIIVALIAAYPAMMETGQEAFLDIRRQFTDARDAKFVQLFARTSKISRPIH
jgi:hypothetical protein